MGVRTAIEDLRRQRMGDGNNGDLRLLAQSEAKPEGAMRGEITDQDVGQRLVIVGLVVLPVQALTAAIVRAVASSSSPVSPPSLSPFGFTVSDSGFSSSGRMKPRSMRNVPS